jgi:hypothetical protein
VLDDKLEEELDELLFCVLEDEDDEEEDNDDEDDLEEEEDEDEGEEDEDEEYEDEDFINFVLDDKLDELELEDRFAVSLVVAKRTSPPFIFKQRLTTLCPFKIPDAMRLGRSKG